MRSHNSQIVSLDKYGIFLSIDSFESIGHFIREYKESTKYCEHLYIERKFFSIISNNKIYNL